jgi:amino acid transporter
MVLVLTPIVWSLPTALMVGELAAALPEEGGYYAWVRRALGPFWGFQEAWLSLAASVFDMALYPTIFTLYLARLWPLVGEGMGPVVAGTAMIAACAAWNVRGGRSAAGAAAAMTALLLAPFAALALLALVRGAPPASGYPGDLAPAASPAHEDWLAGVLVAMWNYMGWDNASTVAGEVDRPQRTYPLAMLSAVLLVAATYLVPALALWYAGVDPSGWTTGSWVDAGRAIGGEWLARALVAGGVVCGVGMFNALVMSYSRLPAALAEDGYLPRALAKRHPVTGAPWVAILACSVAYAFCLTLGFSRLVELDVVIYGLSLVLEFVALVALRVKEPDLARPFRVPGGLFGATALGVGPVALVAIAFWRGRAERAGEISALSLAAVVIAAGPIVYGVTARLRRRAPAPIA